MSTRTMRPLRLVMLLLLLGGSLVTTAGRAAAQELDGDTYTDEEYGWSVAFDDAFWTGEAVDEPTYRGLNLSFEAGFGTLAVYDNGETDPAACLEATVDDFSSSEVFIDFETSRSLDAPETDRAAEGEVFTTTYTSDDTEVPLVFYIECREVDGGTLNIQLAADAEVYEDTFPDFEDLLAAIEIETGGSTRDDTPEPADEETPEADGTVENDIDAGELDGDTFTDTALGYSITWDDRVWTAEILDASSTAAVFLVTDDEELFATVTVDASLGYVGVDVEQCVADYADGVETIEGYSSLREERTIDGLDPPRDGAGSVFSYTYTYEDDTMADLVAYVECRPISDEVMIRVNVQTTEGSLDANAAVFQELLDGIEIGSGGGGNANGDDPLGPDDETPESDDDQEP